MGRTVISHSIVLIEPNWFQSQVPAGAAKKWLKKKDGVHKCDASAQRKGDVFRVEMGFRLLLAKVGHRSLTMFLILVTQLYLNKDKIPFFTFPRDS